MGRPRRPGTAPPAPTDDELTEGDLAGEVDNGLVHDIVAEAGRLDATLAAALPLTRSRLAALIKAG